MKNFWQGFEKQAGIGGAVKSIFRSGISPKAVKATMSAAPAAKQVAGTSFSPQARQATAHITERNYASIPDYPKASGGAAAPKKKPFFGL